MTSMQTVEPSEPTPVVSLDYGRGTARADPLARAVGWVLIAVGGVGVANDLLEASGVIFGRRFYNPWALLWVGCAADALAVAAGVGLVRRLPWGRPALAAYAAYSVLFPFLVTAVQLGRFGRLNSPYWVLLYGVVVLLSNVRGAALGVVAWLAVRWTAAGEGRGRG